MRTATTIVVALRDFESEVVLGKGPTRADARSILSILMLEAGPGSEIDIEVEGSDEQETMDALLALFENNFGED